VGRPAHRVMVGVSQSFLHAQFGLFAQAARFLQSIPDSGRIAIFSSPNWHQHMLRMYRICSKWLIWVAALLSPTQMLHATHIICRVGATCVDRDDTLDEGNQVRCHCSNVEGQSLQREKAADAPARHDGTSDGTQSPCDCPPDCWCWQPAQPLGKSNRPLQCNTLFEFATPVAVADFVDCCQSRRQVHYRTDLGHITPVSGLEQCAGLCRFLL